MSRGCGKRCGWCRNSGAQVRANPSTIIAEKVNRSKVRQSVNGIISTLFGNIKVNSEEL